MRRARPLLLLAIALIIAVVGSTYYSQKRKQEQQESAAPPPKTLPLELNAAAQEWRWSHTAADGRPLVDATAKNFRQLKDAARLELEGVELRIFHKDGKKYDRVRSARADFNLENRVLHSDGDVEITMGLLAEGEAKGRLVVIRSAGVTLDTTSGKASTDRAASFEFDQGNGRSVGATYDPGSRELHMHSQVAVNWRGARPGSKPMRVEAGELRYLEREARIILTSWSKLTRQQMTLNAGPASITLEDGAIKLVETERAHGVDHQPGRELEYSARYLSMHFAANSEIEKLIGDGDARLVATSDSARTTTTADRLELNFQTQSGESLLENALATGKATVESKPQVRAGIATPATRVLRGEMVQLHMQPDGKSLQRVENHSPGTLDFVPNRPDERARHIDAERMGMDYSAGNRLETFRAVNVATRTDPPSTRAKDPAMLTWSKDLLADFDPKTGEMRRLEQWRDFRYEEGDRKGRADHAIFETPPDRITLKGSARFQDTTGSLAADEIAMDQKSGDVLATGHVASSRLPDRKGGGSTVMLSQDEPILAKAARMTTRERNQLVRYEGEAILWQGANRLRAERIEIDRKQDRLSASGGVVSQFQDSPPKPAAGKPAARSKAAPVLTIVRSPELLYIDRERVAHYSGGAHLTRPGMDVKAREIRAYLSDRDAEPKSDSSLDRATADGRVEIVQRDGNRTRRGTAEHADYNVAQEKVVLEGGEPVLDDNLSGTTRGAKLTYFARNGRLLVDGAPSRPAESRIIRK